MPLAALTRRTGTLGISCRKGPLSYRRNSSGENAGYSGRLGEGPERLRIRGKSGCGKAEVTAGYANWAALGY
jgi:hypothetical protein